MTLLHLAPLYIPALVKSPEPSLSPFSVHFSRVEKVLMRKVSAGVFDLLPPKSLIVTI